MRTLVARTEFAAAVNQLANERGVDAEVVINTIKEAILAAYKKDVIEIGQTLDPDMLYEVKLDSSSGVAKIISWKEGDDENKQDITPPGFGRIAAQTAKQVILQKIREAEKTATISQFTDKIDTLVNGMILRFDGSNIVVALGKAEAIMPPHEQVSNEKYRLNQHLTFYLEGIRQTMKGQEIVVSRSHKRLIELLFAREVPEVASESVIIKAIAREPGSRTKIAVQSTQQGVDPVGSCVGQKGVRVQAVIDELNGEKLDIIQYEEDMVKFITSAIAPAEATTVKINSNNMSALVTVPDDQLSLAIGKEGQNVRLAAKLTNFKLDIIGTSGARPSSAQPSEFSQTNQNTPSTSDQTTSSGWTDIKLSARIIKLLESAGIKTPQELTTKSESELLEIPGIGPKAIDEIKNLKL